MSYIDPNFFGVLSQVGYVIFFAFVSFFLFLTKPFVRLFKKLFGKRDPSDKKDA